MSEPKYRLPLVSIGERSTIETTARQSIKHLADLQDSPCDHFCDLIKHQENFLKWIDKRYEMLVAQKEEIRRLKNEPPKQGPLGAKEATFLKYRWYSEQLAILEAINAFEVFFKRTFVRLGEILFEYVDASEFESEKVAGRLIWTTSGQMSPSAMLFEQHIFHDLEAIDTCSNRLVGARRYNQRSPSPSLLPRVKALRGIFQIRHTLSHNGGYVTDGDALKFKRFGFHISSGEVIDLSKGKLGQAVQEELRTEAKEYTAWLAARCIVFLNAAEARGAFLPISKCEELRALLGHDRSWDSVNWSIGSEQR